MKKTGMLNLINKQKSLKWISIYGLLLLLIPLVIKPVLFRLNPFELWKLMSMLWAIAFGIYYLISFKLTGNELIDKIIPFISSTVTFLLPIISIILIFLDYFFGYYLLVDFALAVVYFFTDLWLSNNHTDINERKKYKLLHYIANIPIIFTFSILLVWSIFNYDVTGWHNFMNGFIATTFILINIIFIIIKSGTIKNLYNCENNCENDRKAI